MADSSEAFAREFMDLWQKQLSKALTDPETAGSYIKLMHDFGKAFTYPKDTTNVTPDDTSKRQPEVSQPAAHAYGVADLVIAQLALRISDLEKRIARLEYGATVKPENPG